MHYARLLRHGSIEQTRPNDWGKREKHPLYSTWREMFRRGKAPVNQTWGDFWQFIKDVKEKPSKNHKLQRVDDSLPYGPDNFYWKENIIQEVKKQHKKNESGLSTNPSAIWARRMREINPDYFKDYDLKRQYGITFKQYNEMLEKQNNVCAICGNPETSVIRGKVIRLAVDHDHDTGRVRGLLCSNCNIGIGNFKHDDNLLQKAIEYVRMTSDSSHQPFTP